MTPAEARALIAEGQRVLTAEEHDGPTVWHVDRGSRRMSLRDEDGDAAGEFDDVWFEDFRSAALASWMRTNLARLLDGYTEALEEVERLRGDTSPRYKAACEMISRCTLEVSQRAMGHGWQGWSLDERQALQDAATIGQGRDTAIDPWKAKP